MLPLNKPAINTKASNKLVNTTLAALLSEYHNYKDVYLFMSAGQALQAVYSKLFNERGKLRVLVSPLSCYHAYHPILISGHQIVFADVDPETLCITNDLTKQLCDVVQITHLGGVHPNNHEQIRVAKQRDLVTIEDSAQSFGSVEPNDNTILQADYSVYSLLKGVWAIGGGYCVTNASLTQPKPSSPNLKLFVYRYLKRYLESNCRFSCNWEAKLLELLLRLKSENSFFSQPKGLDVWLQKDALNQFALCRELQVQRTTKLQLFISMITNSQIDASYLHQLDPNTVSRIYLLHKTRKTREVVSQIRGLGAAANHLTQNWLEMYQPPVFDHPQYCKYAVREDLAGYMQVHDHLFAVPFSVALTDTEIKQMANIVNSL